MPEPGQTGLVSFTCEDNTEISYTVPVALPADLPVNNEAHVEKDWDASYFCIHCTYLSRAIKAFAQTRLPRP